jgi:hypothetical protein
MPVMPLNTDSNTWLICFSYKEDGELKFFKEEFVGSIREAMFHEMQLRDLTKDGFIPSIRKTSLPNQL